MISDHVTKRDLLDMIVRRESVFHVAVQSDQCSLPKAIRHTGSSVEMIAINSAAHPPITNVIGVHVIVPVGKGQIQMAFAPWHAIRAFLLPKLSIHFADVDTHDDDN